MNEDVGAFARRHLALNLVATCVAAYGSYAYFHIDEYFQVLELAYFKLGLAPAWSLPWEHAARMRPWLQPALYVAIGEALEPLGVRSPFTLAFAFRLATGLLSWGSLVLFVRAGLAWFSSAADRRFFVRVATLTGFLPYLFVRTSSETLAAAAFTAGLALALGRAVERDGRWSVELPGRRAMSVGVLLGLAFEARFQSALLSVGLVAWLARAGRAASLAAVAVGALVAVAACVLVDAWGYGSVTFPAWTYVEANLVDGVAALFGSSPPFAYAWLLPANLFMPIVALYLALAVVAWWRSPGHPLTWATLPFFLVHNALTHKEERFLFPMATLGAGLVAIALRQAPRIEPWRRGKLAAALAVWNALATALVAVWPVGWHHHVRFQRYVHDAQGGSLVAYALPEFDLGLPAFHGRVYDIAKADAAAIARSSDRAWLVADTPRLATGTALDERAILVWSELPFGSEALLRIAEAYDRVARPPLRPVRFRSLYRLEPADVAP